jgi:mRNA-degrading endonuclease RelE of RelBE toxin-antitoxin system
MLVVLSSLAQEQLADLPLAIIPRILALVARLANWPEVSGLKRLKGDLAGRFRIRTGDYRLIFRVEPTQVVIESIGHRKDIYE